MIFPLFVANYKIYSTLREVFKKEGVFCLRRPVRVNQCYFLLHFAVTDKNSHRSLQRAVRFFIGRRMDGADHGVRDFPLHTLACPLPELGTLA